MGRVLAGIACALLLISGTVLMWRGNAKEPGLPPAPAPRLAAAIVPSVLIMLHEQAMSRMRVVATAEEAIQDALDEKKVSPAF